MPGTACTMSTMLMSDKRCERPFSTIAGIWTSGWRELLVNVRNLHADPVGLQVKAGYDM